MKCILLPIKPQFVEEIRIGNKLYEYRRVIHKDNSINKILIYSSYPIKKVVAVCSIEMILCNKPEIIWDLTSSYSGIDKDFFDKYFNGYNLANAIKMKDISFYEKLRDLSEFGLKTAPQSFQYLELPESIL